ncbi:hypothetical protein ACFX2F_026839 [Malus domestica]
MMIGTRKSAPSLLLPVLAFTGKDLGTGLSRSTRTRPGVRILSVLVWAGWDVILLGCSKPRAVWVLCYALVQRRPKQLRSVML